MRAEDIRPLTEHRANISEDFRRVQETGRPLFITTNGRTAGVLLSPEAYDELADRAAIAEDVAAIRKALNGPKRGRGRDAGQALRDIATKIGVKLDR